MKTVSLKTLTLSLILSLCAMAGANATSTTVNWTGSSDFDSEAISFAAFTANQLSISSLDAYGPGGYAHTHGGTMAFSIQLMLDGTWTTVYSQQLDSNYTVQYLSQLPTISFTSGQVTGLWLDSSPSQFSSYHGFYGCLDQACTNIGGNAAFNFDSTAQAVPEPASAALIGLGLLGLAARRRRNA